MAENPKHYILCPYCGHLQKSAERCEECNGLFEPLSRLATQIAMGPWFIRDKARPFRPGCSYDVIRKQAISGKLKPTSILRGPTTRQFWSLARHTPGVAHLMGFCHACDAHVSKTATSCPKCEAKFEEPADRNLLGLQFTTAAAAADAQKSLDEQLAAMFGQPQERAGKTTQPAPSQHQSAASNAKPASAAPAGADLLDSILGTAAPATPTTSRGDGGAAAAKPAASPAAQTLDFTPSEEAMPVHSADEQALELHSRKLNRMTWVLVALNVLIGVVLVGVFITLNKKADSNDGVDAAVPSRPPAVTPVEDNLNRAPSPSATSVAPAIERARELERQGNFAEALKTLQDYAGSIPREKHTPELTLAIQRVQQAIARQGAKSLFDD